jgi:hypothetical protein
MRASLWRRGGSDVLPTTFGSGWNRESGGRVPGGGGAAGTKRRLGLQDCRGWFIAKEGAWEAVPSLRRGTWLRSDACRTNVEDNRRAT